MQFEGDSRFARRIREIYENRSPFQLTGALHN